MTPKWPLHVRLEVTWRDSSAQGGWRNLDDYKSSVHVGPCKSLGYLVSRTRGMLTLAQSQSAPTGQVSDIVTIPAEAIVKVRKL